MARIPTLSREEAESELGPRGALHVTVDNRGLVRKWLTACGVSSGHAGGLSLAALQAIYNDVGGRQLSRAIAASEAELARIADDAAATPDVEWVDRPAPAPAPAPANGIAAAIQAAIQAAMDVATPAINESSVRAIVADEIAKVTLPRPVRVEIADRPPVIVKTAHPAFERVLRLVMRGANVLLVGPAGCGKSHLCEQVATALGREFGFISGSAGVSESALTGWLLPADGGRFEYQPSEFVRLYEGGDSLFLFDEIDAFDPNMLLTVNAALANGHMSVPHRRDRTLVKRGENVAMVAAANTYGTGASPVYAGRNAMDGASMDRWLVVPMDYDRNLESRIAADGGLDSEMLARIWRLRDKTREAGLRRIVSTRAIQKAAALAAIGDKPDDILAVLTLGWTKDELAKVA